MYEAVLVIYLLVSVGLVALILLQEGKGTDMGASFGAGASGTLFGSSGSSNFMARMTAALAALFFLLSLVLGNMGSKNVQKGSQWNHLIQPQKSDTPLLEEASPKPVNDIPQ